MNWLLVSVSLLVVSQCGLVQFIDVQLAAGTTLLGASETTWPSRAGKRSKTYVGVASNHWH